MPGSSNLRARTIAATRQRRPWYERDQGSRLAHDRALVDEHYPELRYRADDYAGRVWLEGTITLRTESGIPTRIDTRVEFPEDYPSQEPRVYETAGRFPRDPDRHLLSDGRCCLWLDPESKWDSEDPDALLSFLDETVLFFERQLIRELYPDAPWPGGQRAHGAAGYLEYVQELLDGNRRLLTSLTPVLAGGVRVGRNAPCPCGGGSKYKNCCMGRVQEIKRRVGASTLREALGVRST